MGEIDDLYKQEAEDIDTAFLEELKTTKNHDKSFEKYRNNLDCSRKKFVKKYGKFNSSETRRIWKIKKKIKGMGKFKHLEINHFDFKFGFWEKLWMGLDVGWFNFVRKIRRLGAWVFPEWLIYEWCKSRGFVRTIWRDFVEYLEVKKEGSKNSVVKFGVGIWEWVKRLWAWVNIIFEKILFWRKEKAEEKKDGVDEEDTKKEDTKKSEA